MGSFSLVHWIIVGLVILVLFGRGKISETMGDFGKGIRSFKKGLSDEDERRETPPPAPPPAITEDRSTTTSEVPSKKPDDAA